MPSGKKFTTEQANEMQRKSVISRKRNSLSRADGEKQEPTRERKARAIDLHAQGFGLEAIAKKLGTSTRSIRRYLPGVDWRGNTKNKGDSQEREEGTDIGTGRS